MITDTKKAIKFIILIVIGFIMAVVISGIVINKRLMKYEKITRSTDFDGSVESIRKYKSSAIIKSNNVEYIIYGADNFNYSPPFLNEFIQQGDILKKVGENDTLFIFKNGKEYFFLLGSTINRK
jgi:hypothetical protein